METEPDATAVTAAQSIEIRVRGRVQGVGFRPFVWQQARALGLAGHVLNDGEGVLIRASGAAGKLAELVARIEGEPPPLAVVTGVETKALARRLAGEFEIVASGSGAVTTEVAPDAVMCADCAADIRAPGSRRYRYPFTTCTNCGPRLTIVARMPYDRATTSMAPFALCPPCAAEYANPADRRFHAETTACPECGPQARLVRLGEDTSRENAGADFGQGVDFGVGQGGTLCQGGSWSQGGSWGRGTAGADDVGATAALIRAGAIVAVKGLGGYHLACDATNAEAVARLRSAKQRERKPFALMARDLEAVRRFADVAAEEEALLASAAGPIVLLRAKDREPLPEAVAPGQSLLGFMLATTPLHALLVADFETPLVMTSGNLSEHPQVIRDADARCQLAPIAPYALMHDREILNRVDDSVVRVAAGRPRLLRRARGYAPAPVTLARGFAAAPQMLALGGDLKNAFCLTKGASAVLSQHIGDLDELETRDDLQRSIALYREMMAAEPQLIACDLHPGYRSTAVARQLAGEQGLPVVEIQHHHAHVASCLAENGWPLGGGRVLGVAMDGLGYGADGTIWGGELLLADYRGYERLGALKPVAMPGGDRASREPWRNLFAHLEAAGIEVGAGGMSGRVEAVAALEAKPLGVLRGAVRAGINAPLASSCGRLFDAVAAALGVCFERQNYEGEAASLLEAAVDRERPGAEAGESGYPFRLVEAAATGLLVVDPAPMWRALLDDIAAGVTRGVAALRFHRGLAGAIAAAVSEVALCQKQRGAAFDTVALSGGCFNNRLLLEDTERRLAEAGFRVLSHVLVPAGDGGLALGQAAVAAASVLERG